MCRALVNFLKTLLQPSVISVCTSLGLSYHDRPQFKTHYALAAHRKCLASLGISTSIGRESNQCWQGRGLSQNKVATSPRKRRKPERRKAEKGNEGRPRGGALRGRGGRGGGGCCLWLMVRSADRPSCSTHRYTLPTSAFPSAPCPRPCKCPGAGAGSAFAFSSGKQGHAHAPRSAQLLCRHQVRSPRNLITAACE